MAGLALLALAGWALQATELADVLAESKGGLDRIAAVTRELRGCDPRRVTNVSVADVAAETHRALDQVPAEAVAGVRVIRQIEPTAPVRCDAQLFSRVVHTLLRNAADATRLTRNPHEVHVRLSQLGPTVRLDIDDNGAGIPAAIAARIFDPFLAIKPPGDGRGLSLATSHALVRAAGGSLSVVARPEGGSRFSMCLPAVAGQGMQAG